MPIITSWDDGHPLDLRLAELLQRRGFPGTFFVPMNNDRCGQPVLDAAGLRELDQLGELASHTLDHCYLLTVDDAAARSQIVDGRRALEDVLGHAVTGFCYPGGQYAPRHRAMVVEAGFAYARTSRNLYRDASDGGGLYDLPTSLQFYPHGPGVYLRNGLRQGDWRRRAPLWKRALRGGPLMQLLSDALEGSLAVGGTFHLWGHAWELNSFGGWSLLDAFLRHAAERVPPSQRFTQAQAVDARQGPDTSVA